MSKDTYVLNATAVLIDSKNADNQKQTPGFLRRHWKAATLISSGLGIVATGLTHEYLNSTLTAKIYTAWNQGKFSTKTSTAPLPPGGPEQDDHGYMEFPKVQQRLAKRGYPLVANAEYKDPSITIPYINIHIPIPPLYDIPVQAGVILKNSTGQIEYQSTIPFNVFEQHDIGGRVLDAYAFIEDQNILDPHLPPTYNRALNYPRIAKAALGQVKNKVGLHADTEGASGCEMQNFKNQNVPEGRVKKNVGTKIAQIIASPRLSYRNGPDTRKAAMEDALRCINTMRLSAHPAVGEIKGVRDGMAVWYGVDGPTFDRLIVGNSNESAKVYRQMYTLIAADKMPDRYLKKEAGYAQLNARVEGLIRVQMAAGKLTEDIGRKALAVPMPYAELGANPVYPKHPRLNKAVETTRLALLDHFGLSGVDANYKLDRWQVTATSTIAPENAAVTQKFYEFLTPQGAINNKLTGFQMLRPENAPHMTWNMRMLEKLPDGQVVVRINTDTARDKDGKSIQGDANSYGKQNKGSTSKEHTLETDQWFGARIYDELHAMDATALKAMVIHPEDKKLRWSVVYMTDPATGKTKTEFLNALKQRLYSGALRCWRTGRSLNCPQNFDNIENHNAYAADPRGYNQNEALAMSVNLATYRVADEWLPYIKYHVQGIDWRLLDPNPDAEIQAKRRPYLVRHADMEGTVYLERNWIAQSGKTTDQVYAMLAAKTTRAPEKLGVIYLSLNPQASFEDMDHAVRRECVKSTCRPDEDLRWIYDKHASHLIIDIEKTLVTCRKLSPSEILSIYHDLNPDAYYFQARTFLAEVSPDVYAGQDFSLEYSLLARPDRAETLQKLTRMTDRSVGELSALYMKVYPEAPMTDFKKFVMKELSPANKKTLRIGQDLKVEYAAYSQGRYRGDTYYYPFSLEDRSYITRTGRAVKVHPLALEIGRLKNTNPNLKLAEATEMTRETRQDIYKNWLINSKRFGFQNQKIADLIADDAWGIVEDHWHNVGAIPRAFHMVRALGSVIGSSGNTDENLANFNMTMINVGKFT